MPFKELDIQAMHMINRLPGFQKAVLGYELYKVRSIVDQGRMLHWVDVYTKTGLVIKTKYDYISSSKLSRFIIDVMTYLRFRNKE
jgi:hypothetical protein